MSLFVGNISPHVCPSELQRVFRRFGRSNLELKDGYGFVVYDAVRDAEVALRTLKGRIICGEQLSITWSKKQRPLRRFNGKEFPKRNYANRNFRKEGNNKDKYLKEWEYTAKDNWKHTNPEVESVNKNDFTSKGRRDDCFENKISGEKQKHQNLEAVLNERCAVEPIPLDRWGEPLSEASNEHDMPEETTDLQRYDPYSADNRNDGDGFESDKHQKTRSDSFVANSSPERVVKQRSKDETQVGRRGFRKSPERCRNCGRMGHVTRNCHSMAVDSRMDKFKISGLKQRGGRNFRGNGFIRSKGPREAGWSRPDFSGEFSLRRKDLSSERTVGHVKDRRHHHLRTGRFAEHKQNCTRNQSADRNEDKIRENTGRGRKRLRTDLVSRPTRRKKESHSSSLRVKSRNDPHSSTASSLSQSSFSRSRSSRSISPSASSCSRSPSPRSQLRSSGSRSVSSHPRSQSVSSPLRSAKSISKSKSHSVTPRSLSVLLSPCVQKSPVPTPLDHGVSKSYSESQHAFREQMRQKNCANTDVVGDLRLAVKIENDLRVRVIQDDEKAQQIGIISDNGNFPSKVTLSICKEDNGHSNESADKQNVSEGDKIMKVHMAKCPVLENAEPSVDTTTQLVSDSLRTTREKGDNSLLLKANAGTFASISLEEVKMIVKHSQGLAVDEIEDESSVESYLGAGRLWPWEVIRYRKLKRGAISVANYARRKEQNEMFGIVDKYVRSSSGWWENEYREF